MIVSPATGNKPEAINKVRCSICYNLEVLLSHEGFATREEYVASPPERKSLYCGLKTSYWNLFMIGEQIKGVTMPASVGTSGAYRDYGK